MHTVHYFKFSVQKIEPPYWTVVSLLTEEYVFFLTDGERQPTKVGRVTFFEIKTTIKYKYQTYWYNTDKTDKNIQILYNIHRAGNLLIGFPSDRSFFAQK